MAGATLYRIRLDVADVDRGVYLQDADLRVALHPSEDAARLVTRVLAYALLYDDELEMGRGLSDVEEPALWKRDPTGRVLHWVDVGVPSCDRVHRASKLSDRVSVVCHRARAALMREARRRAVHRASDVEVLLLPQTVVPSVAGALERSHHWSVVRSADELQVNAGDVAVSGTLERVAWSALAEE